MNIYHDENYAYFKRELLGKTVKIKLSEITEVNIDTTSGYSLACVCFNGYTQHVPLEFNTLEEYHDLIGAIQSLPVTSQNNFLKFNGESYGDIGFRDPIILKMLSKTAKSVGIVGSGLGVINGTGGGDCG